ncbi:MAG: asparagine synthase (glutamine-hydrolyzing) [Nitrospirota bacterium]
MCGIAGQVTADRRPVAKHVIEAMGERLRHRGPDDHGIYVRGHVGLAHRRLSILDLSPAGHQPMTNEDGSVWLVFNGEIYNFEELRRLLEDRHTFRSRTDTEVIIHLYEQHGVQCLSMLRGMFAFAIWDERTQRLVLARDRLGKKPLFYSVLQGGLMFASELKALLAGGIPRDIDPVAIHYYLTYQYIPAPRTIFRNVRKLLPGHVLVYEDGKASESSYWSLRYDDKLTGRTDREYVEEFRSLLQESVRLRLASDVPLGAFLSGGVDSSSIVAEMSRLMTQPVKTFSIGFKEAAYNELPYARDVAKRFGTNHHEFIVESSAVDILPTLVRVYDEPYADSSAIPTFYVSQLCRQFVTVVLNGDGGDELFGGYPRYRFRPIDHLASRLIGNSTNVAIAAAELRKLIARLPGDVPEIRGIQCRLDRLFMPIDQRYLERICYFTPAEAEALYTSGFGQTVRGYRAGELMSQWFDEAQASTFLDKLLSVDTRSYLPDDLLVKVDRATMAHGLEARSPLLDHRLVEFAASLPVHMKIRNGETKYLLKEAMRDVLPDSILNRDKKGFGVPIDRWFRIDCHELVRETLLSDRCTSRGYFKSNRVRQIIETHQQTDDNYGSRLYALLMLELWHREYMDGSTS